MPQSNQHEVNSIDQYQWREHREKLTQRIKLMCKNLGVSCGNVFDQNLDNFASDKLVDCRLFDKVPYVDEFECINQKLQQSGKHLFYFTDNIVDNDLYAFSNVTVMSMPEFLGSTLVPTTLPDCVHTVERLYNCFIQRTDSVRQTFFYFLHLNNLLENGFVSYLLFAYNWQSCKTGSDLFEEIHYQHQLNQLDHFDRAFEELKENVPYKNFAENHNLNEYTLKSKYSLVLETYATEQPGAWCITEKTLRNLQLPTVSLLFGQKHSCKILSDLGFCIEDYNMELDDLDWQIKQKSLIDILVNDTVYYDLEYMKHKCNTNRRVLRTMLDNLEDNNYLDSYQEIIQRT